jgi:imidazole glycerol-phosphate synthase subunit HisH
MSKKEVVIIDYGLGNLLSVKRAVEKCDATAIVTNNSKIILKSKSVILPGVGAFSKGIQALQSMQLDKVINELYSKKTPLLGICLGMQLFFDSSEEFGETNGLGILPGKVIPIPGVDTDGEKLMIPNNGWKQLVKPEINFSYEEIFDEESFNKNEYYFTHSYQVRPANSSIIVAECEYGGYKIPAFIAKDNLFGFQFHPEKSGEAGLNLLRKFINY